jgi:curved DNA-binding protein CbpA
LSTPKSFSDISTAYNKLSNIQGDEVPDLKVLLEENFVFDGSIYRKPSSNEEKLKAIDKRNRTLKREFESLLVEAKNSRTKMRKVRKEAIVYGFEEAYKSKRYDDILTIGNKLHKSIIENSQEISEFIEIAEIQAEGLA